MAACIARPTGLNWGLTRGYRRTREGYSNEADAPKRVFVRPLCRNPQVQLNHPNREHLQLNGAPKIMLNAEQMRSLPQCFTLIADPRRRQGRRHRLPVVLGIAAGAVRQPISALTKISASVAQ